MRISRRWVFGFVFVVACGTDPSSVVFDLEATSGPPDPQGSVPNHFHLLIVPSADLIDPPDQKTYSTVDGGNPSHQHTLLMNRNDFDDIDQGRSVFLVTSETGVDNEAHNHSFVINP